MAQELLTTFDKDDTLSAVTVAPSHPPPGAEFVVSCHHGDSSTETTTTILWDRRAQEGFPELKKLKQLVRDIISPNLFLGHSDREERQRDTIHDDILDEEFTAITATTRSNCEVLDRVLEQIQRPNVAIQYCTGCRWMLRSAYFGAELLTTFQDEINSLTLIPSRPPEKGGIFIVSVNGEVVWDRTDRAGFPETKELKQVVRDRIAQGKFLGHSDRKGWREEDESGSDNDQCDNDNDDDMDDDEAAEMRAYYGVL